MNEPLLATCVRIQGKPKFLFEVDCKEFPWFITETGPVVTQFADDLYSVAVEILCLDRETKAVVPFSMIGDRAHYPVIGDITFPWVITDDGVEFKVESRSFPIVTLTFVAEDVVTDGIVHDVRDIFDVHGGLIQDTRE